MQKFQKLQSDRRRRHYDFEKNSNAKKRKKSMLALNDRARHQHDNIENFFKEYSRNNFFFFEHFRDEKFDENRRLNDARMNDFSFELVYSQFRRKKYLKLSEFYDIHEK